MNALAFMLPLGLSMAVSVRVSRELGAGRAHAARRAARVGIVLTLLTTVSAGALLVAFRRRVGSAFTRDAELVRRAPGSRRGGRDDAPAPPAMVS